MASGSAGMSGGNGSGRAGRPESSATRASAAAGHARPMAWPTAVEAASRAGRLSGAATGDARPEPAAPPIPPWMRAHHLLPFLAAELQAVLGIRLRLRVDRPATTAAEAPSDAAPLGAVRCGEGRILIAIDGDAAMELLAAVYGSDRAAGPPETLLLSELAPGNASWTALSTMVRRATARALERAGAGSVAIEPPTLADAGLAPGARMPLTLTAQGLKLMMALAFVPAVAPEPAGKEATAVAGEGRPEAWQRQLDLLSRTMPVPVALELCAEEVPLARVMAMAEGDVIPLPPIGTMVMRVAGSPWRTLPADLLSGPSGAERDRSDRDGAGEVRP